MAVPSYVAFASSVDTTLISAPGAGNYIHVVGIGVTNNDTTAGNDVVVRLKDGSGGSNLYGGASGAICLPARGGVWDIKMSYDQPYWDLSANTALYLDVSAARTVAGAVWYYTDTTATTTLSHATFDITSNTSVISAVASQTIKIFAISMHNNGSDYDVVRLTDGSGGTVLYGTTSGAIYLPSGCGVWGLPMSYPDPWFELTVNTALYINPTLGQRVSGTVWYTQD